MTEQETQLAILERQIEAKRQELEALTIQEEAQTERLVIGGLLGVLGVCLVAAVVAESNRKPAKKKWF